MGNRTSCRLCKVHFYENEGEAITIEPSKGEINIMLMVVQLKIEQNEPAKKPECTQVFRKGK